jgi:zinc protease
MAGAPGHSRAAEERPAMETILLPSSSPLVSFRLLFRVGSASDPQGKEGLAALAAAMIAGGGTRRRAYADIVQAMYPMATSFGAQVDKEMTVFYGTTHRDNLKAYFDLVSEMLLEPGWRDDDLRRIRSDAVNFLKVGLRGTNDEELGKEALYGFIYQRHPYGHHTRGRISTLEKITANDLESFYRANYTRQNLVLGLAGGYTPEFLDAVKQRLGSLPAGTKTIVGLPAPAPIDGLQLQIVRKETRATAISFGFPIEVTRGHKDWIALLLVQSYFGQHRSSSSHLYQRLRELRGLNYGDYAYIEYFPRGMFLMHPEPNLGRRQQIFQVWIRPVEPQNAHFALRTAMFELEKLVRDGMKQADFDSTRNFLTKFVNVLTKTEDLRLGYALDSRYYGTPEFTDYVKAGLRQLTLADVNRAIRAHLDPRRAKIVIVARDADALRTALATNAPSPIRYNAPKPKELTDEDAILEKYPLRIPAESIRVAAVEEIFQ